MLATGWHRRIIGLTVLTFILVLLYTDRGVDPVMWATLLTGGLLAYALYRDANHVGQAVSWPSLRGLPYVVAALVPGINVATTALYLLNRWELTHVGNPVTSVDRLRLLRHRPRQTLRGLYAAIGSYIAVYVLLAIVLTVPLKELRGVSEFLAGLLAVIAVFGPVGVILRRRYSTRERQKQYDYALRDLSVRLLPVAGFTVLALVATLVLIVPVFVPVSIVVYALGMGDATPIGIGLLFPLFLLPLAVALALPLRVLPWIRAFPHLLQDVWETVIERVEAMVPFTIIGRESEGEHAILPITGHDHTAVGLDVTTEVELPGIYGYLPRHIDDIAPRDLPSSMRRGLWYLVPGYVVAAVAFTYFQYYPERAAAYSTQFPAEDVIVVSLSLAGIPHSVVTGLLDYAGLAPETLSLGLLGVVFPAALMVPGAWHLALEYEGYLYRLLQRLGDGNHLLLLWGIHVIPVVPVVLGYIWWTERDGIDVMD